MTGGFGLTTSRLNEYRRRYRGAEWRAAIFADMVLDDLRELGPLSTVLDIGCGGGFDGAVAFQELIASKCQCYVGVEPDLAARPADCFSSVHRALFEDAPVPTNSVDLAFGVMVVEHVADPLRFMTKVADVLKDHGVFWAFTVDCRHWSTWSSMLMEKSRVKTAYLDAMHGRRGEQRYANYPVHYRLNSPRSIARYARAFVSIEVINLARVGAEDDNLPRILHPINHWLDQILERVGAPGSNLAVRLVRDERPVTDTIPDN